MSLILPTFFFGQPLRLPYTTLDNKRLHLKLLKKIVEKADHIVTVSECSRRDIIDILGVDPSRVTNTYQSVTIPAKLKNKTEEEVALQVEGIFGLSHKNYYLFWGAVEPKKNIGRMIEAYLSSKVSAPLVIIGSQGWKSQQELRLLDDDIIRHHIFSQQELRASRRVIQIPHVPFGVLVSLIRGAKAALFPSLYEGFGLPALEAMMLGTPLICSNTASLPEIVGDAAMAVDPYDVAALSSAIRKVDSDADLREHMTLKGYVQSEKFSPENHRAKLKDIYLKIL